MNRSSNLLLIAVALAVYGFSVASAVPAMLVGPAPGLLIAFVLQAVFAIAAAIGVWRGQRWGGGAVWFLGISVACTSLFEAFVLGIIAYLRALLVSVVVLALAFIVAAYVNRQSAVLKR
jgi:hypothetical protein